MASASTHLTNLRNAIQSSNVEDAKKSITHLKILLLDLPPESKETEAIATETLENAVLLSIQEGDLTAFARNVSQLKPYYEISTEKSSENRCKILGLNLMYQLTENRLSEFHAELELLRDEEASSPFITFPINLERQLMVGSYNEVLDAAAHIPDSSYDFFLDNLLHTVRDSIADCMEVAFGTMSVEDAKTFMKFDSLEEFKEYVQDFRDDWIFENDGQTLCFQPPATGRKASDIPSRTLITNVLSYATELERIV